MVAPFEEAAFSLDLNTVSEPVSTEFGIHLIEVTKISGGELQSFSEVKDSIRKTEITRQAEDIYFVYKLVMRSPSLGPLETLFWYAYPCRFYLLVGCL